MSAEVTKQCFKIEFRRI